MTSPKAPKDKIFEKVVNPYLTGVLQHPQSIKMREGMLHIRDVEGPKKAGSMETRLEAMEQQVFKCQGMVEHGLNANHMMITEFTKKHRIDANDIGKHLSRLYDRIDHLHAQIYDLQNQKYPGETSAGKVTPFSPLFFPLPRVKKKMGVGNGSADVSQQMSRNEIRDETTPLLPVKVEEEGFHEFNGASFSGAVFNLSTTIVGAGIMALPASIKMLGLIPGLLMIVFVALLTEASIDMLIRCSHQGKITSYGWLMGEAYGQWGRIALQASVVINNIGVMIVYMIIIGDVLSGTSSGGVHHRGILEGWFGAHLWNSRAIVLLVTTLFVFAPLVSFKRLDSLSYTSALSVALAVIFVVITAGIAIIKVFNGTVAMPKLFPEIDSLSSVWKLFTAVPVLVTAYICHYNVHSIDNELEDKTQTKPIVRTSLALCSSVYIATSFFAYLLFGEGTLDDVLANFDSNLGIPFSSVFNDIVRVSYAAHVMLVFPIVFFALRLNLDGLLFPTSRHISHDNKRFTIITISLLVVIYTAAIFIPSIWDAFQFTGATAAVLIGFIFPAMVILRDPYGIATKRDKILAVTMIVLAVVSNSVALYSDAMNIFRRKEVA
ncbi:sodium-coupled neutral amino acid transporter 2-like [Hordeum vulgare]|nr:sodium-coupled neutral amino acid transporter 2-like [Hordeum vulgare]